MSAEEIRHKYLHLTAGDIRACLLYEAETARGRYFDVSVEEEDSDYNVGDGLGKTLPSSSIESPRRGRQHVVRSVSPG